MTAKTQLLVRLDPKLHKALKKAAQKREVSMTEIVELALKREFETLSAA